MGWGDRVGVGDGPEGQDGGREGEGDGVEMGIGWQGTAPKWDPNTPPCEWTDRQV